jgi:hypothetical protein
MSTKETRKNRVHIAGWCATAGIPFIIAVGAAKMTALTVCLIGLWGFCLEVMAANAEWKKNEFMQRWTRKPWVWVGAIALTFAATGWVACAVRQPAQIDPESTGNKYIRVTPVSPPDLNFRYACLIEFGVRQVNSDGFFACIRPVLEDWKQEDWRQWYGAPGRTNAQTEFDIAHSNVEDGALWVRAPEFTISPRMSYYVCLMAHTAEKCEPNDILYFAVASNASALLPAQKRVIGHQYQRYDK